MDEIKLYIPRGPIAEAVQYTGRNKHIIDRLLPNTWPSLIWDNTNPKEVILSIPVIGDPSSARLMAPGDWLVKDISKQYYQVLPNGEFISKYREYYS